MLSTIKGSVPLYIQIKELLVGKINDGDWLPGTLIPSEVQLAQELSVSQGTVRKAISELVESNVFTRKQGRGTFVASQNMQREFFHFLHVADNADNKTMPSGTTLSFRRKRANRTELEKLHLSSGDEVFYFERVRAFSAGVCMVDRISLPEYLFGSLSGATAGTLPSLLYEFYQDKCGVSVHSASEKLRAVAASSRDAELIGVDDGAPLLEIERVAMTLDKTPVELRLSRLNTESHHYQNTIL